MALEPAPTVTSRAGGAPAAELVEHYEGLRLRGLHPPGTIAGEPGLGVLVARGMRAWMDVVWVPRSSASASDTSNRPPSTHPSSIMCPTELTGLLATMVLNHQRQEEIS